MTPVPPVPEYIGMAQMPTIRQARAALRAMEQDVRAPVRRVVVAPGYRSHERMGRTLANALRRVVTKPEWVIDRSHMRCRSFDGSGARILEAIDEAGWRDEPLDFVGVSMAGLLGRYLAMPEHAGLKIARLFTISTPHRGANAARIARPDPAARDMAPDSERLRELDTAFPSAPYEMVCYGRRRDLWVGTDRLAPEGHPIALVDTPWYEPGHFLASWDVRIMADIARHVRSEPPMLSARVPA